MKYIKKAKFVGILAIILVASTASGRARDFKHITPTLAILTSFSLSTYKSELVASNDTGTGFSYGIGGYAGEDGTLGFFLKIDSASTSFALNSSSNAVTWQDTLIRYRWSYFYLGPIFSMMDYKVNQEGTELLDLKSSGIGGNLGMMVPLGNTGAIFLDLSSVTMSSTVNKLATEANIGSRTDFDLGASIDVTRSLVDFTFGYRQQQYTVSTDSTYTETYLATYLGLNFSFNF
ncbi:hypothetical protein [Pseudobacteriovorax antillogorgiicola]|uniref:Outer membrane protein beta-barrel domain-containing protein n=1 Tax=Pseudobacteriovorax antillogorgiicola TaxID=1513793 RepID=A0A1Y6BCG2_9BACT|nr:hypothetical protein [Pseudobacteriovorax antillogorgiicola]TCS58874.1 hypothetical protein EDD56_102389 [Pseudobacteriovorax antillogorgiicola]SME93785.1 hypothetical protein SAMN06296036_10254 [Pseudobacteriovorax antillogorgiicola]